jgi:hypothetical protein
VGPPAAVAVAEAAFDSVLRALRPAGCYETPPVWCEVVSNQRITSGEWEQDVRHVELRGAVPPYEAGDVAVRTSVRFGCGNKKKKRVGGGMTVRDSHGKWEEPGRPGHCAGGPGHHAVQPGRHVWPTSPHMLGKNSVRHGTAQQGTAENLGTASGEERNTSAERGSESLDGKLAAQVRKARKASCR